MKNENFAVSQSSKRYDIGPLEKTVNHATVVYPTLPRNVYPVPWLARPGYVKKPQDSSTYARASKSLKVIRWRA